MESVIDFTKEDIFPKYRVIMCAYYGTPEEDGRHKHAIINLIRFFTSDELKIGSVDKRTIIDMADIVGTHWYDQHIQLNVKSIEDISRFNMKEVGTGNILATRKVPVLVRPFDFERHIDTLCSRFKTDKMCIATAQYPERDGNSADEGVHRREKSYSQEIKDFHSARIPIKYFKLPPSDAIVPEEFGNFRREDFEKFLSNTAKYYCSSLYMEKRIARELLRYVGQQRDSLQQPLCSLMTAAERGDATRLRLEIKKLGAIVTNDFEDVAIKGKEIEAIVNQKN